MRRAYVLAPVMMATLFAGTDPVMVLWTVNEGKDEELERERENEKRDATQQTEPREWPDTALVRP